jgi:hypothetical protein
MRLFVAILPYERLSDFLSNVLLGGLVALGYAVDEIKNFALLNDDGELASVRLSARLCHVHVPNTLTASFALTS